MKGSVVHYAKSRSDTKGEAALEPNHTKFIFFDDGTTNKFGREIAFRAKLEKALSGDFFASKHTTNFLKQTASLPGSMPVRQEQSRTLKTFILYCLS